MVIDLLIIFLDPSAKRQSKQSSFCQNSSKQAAQKLPSMTHLEHQTMTECLETPRVQQRSSILLSPPPPPRAARARRCITHLPQLSDGTEQLKGPTNKKPRITRRSSSVLKRRPLHSNASSQEGTCEEEKEEDLHHRIAIQLLSLAPPLPFPRVA